MPNDPLFSQTLVIPNPDTLTFEVKGLSRAPWASARPSQGDIQTGHCGRWVAVLQPAFIQEYNCPMGRETLYPV